MMKVYKYPALKNWMSLCQRSALSSSALEKLVQPILESVKKNGDKALKQYSKKFDGFAPKRLLVSTAEFKSAEKKVNNNLKAAIQLAKANIERFHSAQKEKENRVETAAGVLCWRKSIPVERVGLYIPGGTAPLFSTMLMLGVPATIAGCREIIVCTPPDKTGNIAPEILFTAKLLGITSVFKIGGAQAIAAMAFGTKTVPAVDKIFGPGNQYVTMAKMLVQKHGVAIDMPAGPSEVLIIADESCVPEFVAADLLSQAEHGVDSQVVLVSNSAQTVKDVLAEINAQLNLLPRKAIAAQALHNSKAILLKTPEQAVAFSNAYAPEHLIIAAKNPELLAEKVTNAGSVFLGNYSCECAGDYASGTNHTLPTNGFARSYSGVSLDSFVKKITFQQLTQDGITAIGPAIELMAEAEHLFAHKNAVTVRLKQIARAGKPATYSAFKLSALMRQNIQNAKPYSSARDEFSGGNKILLDANENPFDTGFNRYPDPHQRLLKEKIATLKAVPSENIFLGNGSDEAIDLVIRAFCKPGEDKMLICPPTYGMYEVAGKINDVETVSVPLTKNFQIDTERLLAASSHSNVKMLFLCSPNNPTGNLLKKENILRILRHFRGLVVLDEAYIDFSPSASLLSDLPQFPNLVILQTFSKAWGLAGIRLGMAFAHREIISVLDKIKPPYNISELTQQLALQQLGNEEKKNQTVLTLQHEKNILIKRLGDSKDVQNIYPSDANFLLVKFREPKKTYAYLVDNGVAVRDRSSVVPGCLRITIGAPEENARLLKLLHL